METYPEQEGMEDVVLDDERESFISALFLRKTMEGWMGRRPFYIIRSGIYTIQIIRR